MPCSAYGNIHEDFLPDEFCVDRIEDIEGKENLNFKVYINNATGLNKSIANNVFVKYFLKWENDDLMKTCVAKGLNCDPKFDFRKQHCISEVTSNLVNEIKVGGITYIAYAYPEKMMKHANKINEDEQDKSKIKKICKVKCE